MKEVERHSLTPEKVVVAIKNLMKKDPKVGTYIAIEKIWDQEDGWKIVGGIIEK